jgi:hypothetical protein
MSHADVTVDAEFAWRILEGHFHGNRPRRWINGLAISTDRANANGTSFCARGVIDRNLPVPLLLEHNWLRPLGRVVSLDAVGNQLLFRAEFLNSDRLYWATQVWEKILAREAIRISIEGESLVKPVVGAFRYWQVKEVSVVANGADEGAVIEKVCERHSVVYVDGRPSEIIHWDAKP